MDLKHSCSFVLVTILAAHGRSLAQDDPKRAHTLTGEFRAHKNFHSKFLSKDRDILVYLPPDYDKNKRKHYPVFYMHDGQNLFDGATSYIAGKEWRVDETTEELIKAGRVEPVILRFAIE